MRLTNETKEKIITLYESGKTVNYVANHLKVNVKTVKFYLNKSNITIRHGYAATRNKQKDKEENIVLDLYGKGFSIESIAKKLDTFGVKFVKNVLRRNKIPRIPFHEVCRTYTIDETVFDSIDENSAYWIGFLMADGCISPSLSTGNRADSINLGLQSKDKHHLEKYKKFLNSTHPIKLTSNFRDLLWVRVRSKKFFF